MQLLSVQYLRGLAAFMVVIFHLGVQLRRLNVVVSVDWLESGVDIFFVISGFIMWVTTIESNLTPQDFFLKRIFRIVPLYWAVTSCYVLLVLAAPQLLQTLKFDDFTYVICSYLFIPAVHSATGAIEPLVVQGWTLNYEMFFYALFALTLLVKPTIRLGCMLGMLLALCGARYLTKFGGIYAQFYSSTIMLEFGLGMIVGCLCSKKILLPRLSIIPVCLVCGAVLVVSISFHLDFYEPRFIIFGIPAAILVYAAVSFERRGRISHWRWPHLLGDSSYSLYITHAIILSAVSQMWRKAGFPQTTLGLIGFSVVAVLASVIIGVLTYRFVETPLASWTKALQRKRSAVLAV
jgi:exopolysaccharide production protein ExoZ